MSTLASRPPALKAPFPYFGGKSAVGRHVWDAFGDVTHYVEPFAGSLGVLLSVMDNPKRHETVNDLDGYVTNVWRAIQADPDAVAHWADSPVSELDLIARHLWLVNEGRPDTARLATDPDYFDAKAAGWWVWGVCCWIGSGWCSGKGPHTVASITGADDANAGQGVRRKLPHLSKAGQGVHRQLPHLGNAGRGDALRTWFGALSERLDRVRIASGDWSRVVTPAVLHGANWGGVTAVFLDPPYADADMTKGLYASEGDVAEDVARWAFANGDDPTLRIALCGWVGHHTPPDGWWSVRWSRPGGSGYANATKRRPQDRERIWFSPHCRRIEAGMASSAMAGVAS